MADGLYELDFFAWAQKQAALLRSRERASNSLDYENLAEEIESMGASEERACESFVQNILLHFLKLQLARVREPERHWRREIAAFRIGLRRQLSPSLRVRVPNAVPDLYNDALKLFDLEFDLTERLADPPTACPWTWDDILGRDEDWTPEPAA